MDSQNGAATSNSSTGAAPHAPSGHQHQHTKMDISNANRGIWLVKVPKYLSTRWEKLPGDVDAAKLRVVKLPGVAKPRVTLTLTEATLCLNEPGEKDIPKEHELIVASVSKQAIGVFSVETDELTETEKVRMEGKIQQRLECRPYADKSYLELKVEEMKKVSQPQRQVIQLDRAVQNYKPVSDHKHNMEYEQKKKTEGKKSRDDREKVTEMLFNAFEKHQYYSLKDLVRITNQPVTYLKDILKDVCIYCVKSPHRNMFELKPEYRHYKSAEPEAANDAEGQDDEEMDDDDDEEV